ncbi:hypothetical protein PHLCEN_2v5866 [Hermanssonia centrifuga]|uniref:Uncharacterized protein n=1 Tax=Hermanssonia centrifuga TaxID=98765 RepID=A0A2R6P141_9APHY|nr:hypothetical protein PHLCEN_2v5866 [Hermanssonia centrifuga]
MSALSSFLRPLPAARRAYSVFTKPGGGRYFNSSKPLTSATNSTKNKAETPATGNADAASPGTTVDESKVPQATASMSTEAVSVSPMLGVNFTPFPIHPPVNPHDLKLHQFFSLHRPLLTISQPVSSIFEASASPFAFPPAVNADTANLVSIDDPPEASPESDADAARQLARALVANRVGAALSWESTLKRLGLDVTEGRAEEVSLAQAEFDMYMDSTKRKRRKKMKKHK